MHQNNYLFLRHLSARIDEKLRGLQLCACFCQEKDELMLAFCDAENEFWIRATLTNEFSCLSFPDNFSRARKNSVDLFKTFNGKTLLSIRQFAYERAFALVFSDNEMLIFKMYGNRANIVAFENGEVREVFKKELLKDRELNPETLDRNVDFSEEFFLQNGLKKTFPFLGQEIADSLHLSELSQSAQYAVIKAFIKKNEQNPLFYVGSTKGNLRLDFFPTDEVLCESEDAFLIINTFFRAFSQTYFLVKERENAVKLLEKRRKQAENYLQKAYLRLEELNAQANFEKIAHILMANLHQIPERAKEIELFDFYENKNIIIKLKDNLTAAKNAEILYRKAKNQSLETDNLEDNIRYKEEQLNKIKAAEVFILQSENFKELRKFIKEEKIMRAETEQAEEFPFKRTEYKGFEIWVGRNAKNNDLLTLKYAHKEDLWLHARDVPGSHVIIKHQSGKTFPQDVIMRAAEIAAYFSKRKNETVCPVIVTPKKFVRKPKGLPEGAVVLDREKTIMAEPKNL